MRKAFTMAIAVLGFALFGHAGAQTPVGRTPVQPAPPDERIHTGAGTVTRVDVPGGHVVLDHDAIASLGWSAKSTDFVVTNREQLAALRAGQRVRFEIRPLGNQYVISQIHPLEKPAG